MKYSCCQALLHKIAINPDNINFCCSPYDNKLQYLNNYNGELINIEDYLEKRSYYLEQFKAGCIPKPCQGCSYCEERDDWDEEIGFEFISISSRTKCNCDCIYCVQSKGNPDVKKYLNERKCWDIKPVIKELFNANLIKENAIYILGGGEPTIIPDGEFEYLAYVGLITKTNTMVLTNGILYNDCIEKLLTMGKCLLSISVDSGTRETFKKVKRVDKYDDVWKNIKKYLKKAEKNKDATIEIKYILMPGINDSLQEVQAFIKNCLNAGKPRIHIAIEYDWFGANQNKPITKQLQNTLKYFKSLQSEGVFFGDAHDWFEEKLLDTNCI